MPQPNSLPRLLARPQVAVLFPAGYARWREPLCVLVHVAHKLAQAAVTLLPPVGTVFSPHYNPAVALLESSSMAQIHMLAFGVRLRLGVHVAVNAFHATAAVLANKAVCAAGLPFVPSACWVGLGLRAPARFCSA